MPMTGAGASFSGCAVELWMDRVLQNSISESLTQIHDVGASQNVDMPTTTNTLQIAGSNTGNASPVVRTVPCVPTQRELPTRWDSFEGQQERMLQLIKEPQKRDRSAEEDSRTNGQDGAYPVAGIAAPWVLVTSETVG